MKKIVTLLLLVFCSCARTVYVPQTVEKTVYRDRERVDSLVCHDSVFIRSVSRNDTIYEYRDRWHTEYRDRYLHDTVCRVDSVPYPVEVVKVEYRTPGIVRALAVTGLLAVVLFIIIIIASLRR